MKPKSFTNVIISTIMLLSSITLITIYGCNKNQKADTWHLPDEISMPQVPGLSSQVKDVAGKRFAGQVTIFQTGNGEVLISFNNQSPKNFILQTSDKQQATGITKIKNAELIYMADLILLNNLDKNELHIYSVNSINYNSVFSQIPGFVTEKIKRRIEGFGLSFYNQTWTALNENISLNSSIYSVLYPHHTDIQKTNDEDLGPSCSAGGKGSTSCTIEGCTGSPSSCSVSCQSGYYSCCGCVPLVNTAHCWCIAN